MLSKLLLILCLFASFASQATAVTRSNLEIKTWHPISKNRAHATGYNNLTRVYFTVAENWGSTACRTDSADIQADDTNLTASLLAAFMANKKVRIEVNDALPTIDGVCKITAAFIDR